MRKSKTLARIRNNQTVRMCCLGHYMPFFVKQAAHFGFDCIWLDLEHRNFSDRDVQALLAYAHLHDIDIMVRPATLEKTRLYRYLEDGAAGLMIPHVNTAEKARMLVDAVKFPPIGDRGLDGAGLDADFYVGDSDTFVKQANEETFLVVQIETLQAVQNVEEIAAVPGVLMLIGAKFPKSEQEAAGVSYREMLGEFGAFGALVGFGLILMQLSEVFGWNEGNNKYIAPVLAGLLTLAFGAYTRSFGRPIMAFLIIIMMPLATTEIGTDSWISGLMEEPMKAAGRNAVWVLVYTSAIMMVLRFFAGPIVHSLSPIGLLIMSSVLAIAGLFALSKCGDAGLGMIFAAATLYGFGKTFFWPTMLGVTAEQCPKGGALTLNAISGIGMIAVGVLGTPFIGYVQAQTASADLTEKSAAVAQAVIVDKDFMGISYQAIDPDKEKTITDEAGLAALKNAKKSGSFEALGKMVMFPAFMLTCYIILFLYFKSKGGYKAQALGGNH